MTNEEREIITRFIGRVGGATQAGGFGGGASGTPAPLPPVDKEADDLIGQLLTQYPEARYRITQMAFVQEAALAEAQNRMQRMQWELDAGASAGGAGAAASRLLRRPVRRRRRRPGRHRGRWPGARRRSPSSSSSTTRRRRNMRRRSISRGCSSDPARASSARR